MLRGLLRPTIYLVVTLAAISCQSSGGGEASSDQYELLPYLTADRWGYVNQSGKSIINPQFSRAELFHGGLARVENMAHKIGYINPSGAFTIAPAYEAGLSFSEGLACVVPTSGQITFVDTKGTVKFVVANAREARSFHEGLAAVRIGEKWGYINPEGRLVIPPSYNKAASFADGRARVEQQVGPFETKIGFIDKNNAVVIPLEHSDVSHFSQNRAVVKAQGKYGFIDEKGAYAIRPQFDQAGQFSLGLAPVRFGRTWGFVDEKGNIVINPSYAGVLPFSANGLALAADNNTQQMGFLDREGKWAIAAQFELATPFYADIAFAKVGDKWGIIDKTGKFLENPTFDNVYQSDITPTLLAESDPSIAALARPQEPTSGAAPLPVNEYGNASTPTTEVLPPIKGSESSTAVESADQETGSPAPSLPSQQELEKGAPAVLVGTWQGSLEKKPFTLHIDKLDGKVVSGWNQVGNNKRPITGSYWAWIEGDACGYGLKLSEPGDDKWDGKFELQVTSKDGGALDINHTSGTWTANNGRSEKSVSLDK